jgi:hypothetical protein
MCQIGIEGGMKTVIAEEGREQDQSAKEDFGLFVYRL